MPLDLSRVRTFKDLWAALVALAAGVKRSLPDEVDCKLVYLVRKGERAGRVQVAGARRARADGCMFATLTCALLDFRAGRGGRLDQGHARRAVVVHIAGRR